MASLTLKEAARFLNTQAKYILREGRRSILFPVTIIDARVAFGRLEFGFVPVGGSVSLNGQPDDCGWATEKYLQLEGRRA